MSPIRRVTARAVDLAVEATVAPSFSRIGCSVRSRLEGWEDVTSLPADGRHVLITGANSGLGYATARAVLAAGGQVTGTVRSPEKGGVARARLADDLRDDLGAELGHMLAEQVAFEVVDLAELASVHDLADRLSHTDRRLDVVVHNAGSLFADHEVTVDGLERTYQVHVVAPFLLTSLLLPQLLRSASARVVTVTSGGMYTEGLDVERLGSADDYRGAAAYARAKRAQVVLTAEWARRFAHPDHPDRPLPTPGTGPPDPADLAFHAMHPGWALTPGVESSLPTFRRLTGPVLRSPEQGADTIAWLALHPDLPGNGRLWHDRRPRSAHRVPWTRTRATDARRLWDRVSRDAGIIPDIPAGTTTSPTPGSP